MKRQTDGYRFPPRRSGTRSTLTEVFDSEPEDFSHGRVETTRVRERSQPSGPSSLAHQPTSSGVSSSPSLVSLKSTTSDPHNILPHRPRVREDPIGETSISDETTLETTTPPAFSEGAT